MKIYDKPRRSGKTSHLIEQIEWVNIFSRNIPHIWVVIPSTAMKEHIKARLIEKGLYKHVRFCTYMGHTFPPQPDYVFVDEYQYCNDQLIDHIRCLYYDKTVMWGTPREYTR